MPGNRDTNEALLRQRRVLANFADVALQSEDLDAVLQEACRLVGEALGTGRAKVLEIEQGGESLLVRAGVGWAPGVVGHVHIPTRENSSESYAIEAGVPVITQDISKEDRFGLPDFLKEAGIVALANVPIFLPGKRAYGLLQVDDTEPRDFDQDDIEFLHTYASVLGPVIDRLFKAEQLRSSEEQFRLTVEEATDYAILLLDAEGRITDWLPGAQAVFGWSAEEARGQPVAMLFTSEDRDAGEDRNEVETARHEGRAPDVRWHLRKDGSRVFIDGVTRALKGPDGQVRGFIKIGQDVTERRRAEERLRESEERYRAIVDTAQDYAIFTIDPEGLITTWPVGARKVFGWTAEEAIGQPIDMTFMPEDRAIGAPETERNTSRAAGYAPDVRWHLRNDGSRVFIDGANRPLTGPDGTLAGFVKVGQDVTERRATEAALRESEARFQQFGEASSDVLWIRNAETLAYEYLSPAYETVYGSPREEALRGNQMMRWMEAVHPDDRERVLDLLRRVRAGERASETYRIIRHSDGAMRWIRNSDFPLLDAEGRVQRIGGISHDATEEVEVQERLQVLVTELQHRTRNLIGVVNSIAHQTMAHTGPTEAFREEFSHRMAALSRVQGLLSRSQQEPITLRALLMLELDALGAKEGEGVRFDGPWVRIRPTIVQTVALVVHELATNARKYGALSDGGGRLSVEWRVREVDGERRVFIEWREEELSPNEASPSADERSGGYGRRLIEKALPYALKAQTTYELGATELRCTIDLPLDREMQAR